MDYLKTAETAVAAAMKIGSYMAEAYVLDAKALSIEVANQAIETLKLAEDVGVGIRVFSNNGTVGFAYSTDLQDVAGVARQALDNSRKSFSDRFNMLPDCPAQIPQMDLLDMSLATVRVEDKIELAKRVERAARQADSRVKRTERCGYDDTEYGVALANSNGLSTYYRSAYCDLYGMVLAEVGDDVQSGMGLQYTRHYRELSPETVGKEAAEDAGLLLGAKTIGTVKAAVILTPYIATSFFSVLIPALSADAVQKGRSLFKDRLNQSVVSPLLTLVDDGCLLGGIGTRPVDGEGVPTQRTELIRDGVLQGFLYNTYTAAKDQVNSTGNGIRGSFRGMPEVGTTNIFIEAGAMTRERLISEVQDGFYVTNVMGMHTANPISGDFSVGAAGVWVRNGQLAQAVRGVAIAGNILDLFGQVDAVADDLRFFGGAGAPTLRIEHITVSGS